MIRAASYCAELAAKERLWKTLRDGLRPGNDYELPSVDEVAAELRLPQDSVDEVAIISSCTDKSQDRHAAH